MSEPEKPEPDEDLLEFLGGIDEVNDESQEGDFADFLARVGIDKAEIEKVTAPPKAPVKEGKSE